MLWSAAGSSGPPGKDTGAQAPLRRPTGWQPATSSQTGKESGLLPSSAFLSGMSCAEPGPFSLEASPPPLPSPFTAHCRPPAHPLQTPPLLSCLRQSSPEADLERRIPARAICEGRAPGRNWQGSGGSRIGQGTGPTACTASAQLRRGELLPEASGPEAGELGLHTPGPNIKGGGLRATLGRGRGGCEASS